LFASGNWLLDERCWLGVLIKGGGCCLVAMIWASAHTRAHRVKEGGHPEELSCASTGLFQGTGYSRLALFQRDFRPATPLSWW